MYDSSSSKQLNSQPGVEHSSFPLITVVIPTYNRLSFVMEAIRSVIAQTYTNWELIIADDGSTDGTAKVIGAMNDSRIRILELSHIGHVGCLRNKAAQEGKGKWIAFLDSDDLWLPGKLEIQLNSLQRSARRWGYGGFELMNESANTITNRGKTYIPFSGWVTKKIINAEAAVSIGSLIIERQLFDEVGCFSADLKLNFREDYELALRLSLKAEADAVPELLVRIREHAERSTNKLNDAYERMALAYTEFLHMNPGKELKKAARKQSGYHLAEAAINNFLQKKYLLAFKQLGKALSDGDRLRHVLSVLSRASRLRSNGRSLNH